MKPVDQTFLKPPEGNCFAACVASILEVPLEALPNFKGENWCDLWNQWLEPLNLRLLMIEHRQWLERPPGYAIVGVDSPRGDWLHAVVCKDGEIVHDPHPERHMGVGEFRDWTLFMVLDPSKPIKLAHLVRVEE